MINQLYLLRPDLEVSYVGIDPKLPMLDLANKNLRDLPHNATVSLRQIGVHSNSRLTESLGKGKFDFLLASFVMFWIEDWADAFQQFLECLNPVGLFSVIQISKDICSESAQLRRCLYEIANRRTPFRMEFAEDFEQTLGMQRIRYETDSVKFDISLNNSINYMDERIEFICRYPKEELSSQQIESMIELVRKFVKSGTIECCQKVIWAEKNNA